MKRVFFEWKNGKSVEGQTFKIHLKRMPAPADNGVLEVGTQRLCPSQALRPLSAQCGERNRYIYCMESKTPKSKIKRFIFLELLERRLEKGKNR